MSETFDPLLHCHDCGRRAIHRDAPTSKCRECAEQGGDRYAFVFVVDRDKLRACVGDVEAERIERACARP